MVGWSDGRKEDGSLERITDQFVTFVTDRKPPSCENVELSKIAGVHWRATPVSSSLFKMGYEVFIGAVLTPSFLGHEVAYPFRRIFPPLQPLRGEWESIGELRGGVKSYLDFKGRTVRRREVTVKQGNYHVEQNQLYLIFTGGLETSTPFRFECGDLILDTSRGTFRSWATPHRVSPPIVGDWRGSNSKLDLKPDGSFKERTDELRSGTFEMTSTGVRIRWTGSQGPGGEDWIAQFKHHHLVVRAGGVTTAYRYVPPAFDLGP